MKLKFLEELVEDKPLEKRLINSEVAELINLRLKPYSRIDDPKKEETETINITIYTIEIPSIGGKIVVKKTTPKTPHGIHDYTVSFSYLKEADFKALQLVRGVISESLVDTTTSYQCQNLFASA